MFMAAVVGLIIIGTAARADDKSTGSITGTVVAVAPDGHMVYIKDPKNGKQLEVKIGADTKITSEGKAVEGGVRSLKPGSTVKIAWEMDMHGTRVGTQIHVVIPVHD
jgi:hypothetical protein